jgi:hypothetical protein
MIKKVVSLMFIPVSILLYISSGKGSSTLAFLGVGIFIVLALSQIVLKN